MASGRAHLPPSDRLLTPSEEGDDKLFPLSIAIHKASSINGTLPKLFAENINPPFDVARRLYFKNEHAEGPGHLDDGRLMYSAGQGNPGNAPRSFITEEPWKIPTWHDLNFVFGTNQAIPVGFQLRHPNPPNIFDVEDDEVIDFNDDYVSIANRSALEETLFNKSPKKSEISKRIEYDDTPDALRTEARRFLESTRQTFVRFAGCTEKQIMRRTRGRYCCFATSLVRCYWEYDAQELAKRLFAQLHQRPWCVRNTPCHFLLNSLDVSVPTKDGVQLAHVFSIRLNHNSTLRDQVFEVLKEARNEDVLEFDRTQENLNPISEFDLGFMQVKRKSEE